MNTKKSAYASKYHRDGTVTLWNVYAQVWQRRNARNISDEVLASLSDCERARISKMAAK